MKKNLKIGTKAYVKDNSYAINLRTGTNDYLTGVFNNNIPIIVTVKSEPFMCVVNTTPGNKAEKEMVMVLDPDGDTHMVFNLLEKVKEDVFVDINITVKLEADRDIDYVVDQVIKEKLDRDCYIKMVSISSNKYIKPRS